MVALIFASLFIYLIFCRPYHRNLFRTGEYMNLQRTTLLNGIFILLVFVSHVFSYIEPQHLNIIDRCCKLLCGYIGQLMVAGFFFYSGFGIMESITRKGSNYLDKFPSQRFCKVLLHFDIAVLCFWLLTYLLGISYTWDSILLAFTGWTSIGNSNWFIFVTLVLYLITYVSFRWCGKWCWFTLWLGCFLLMVLLFCTKGSWWYDTFLCFPAGMAFSALRERIEHLLSKSKLPVSMIGLFMIATAILICRLPLPIKFLPANLAAILMAYGTILLVACIDFKNPPQGLLWMGGALFSIYIFQRIPMLALAQMTNMEELYPALYILTNLVLTILIALVAGKFYKRLDAICFPSKK